ncbi:MAG: hypothetical protein WD824_04490 [Cyclobacteriaceae bacterium]
MIRSFTFLILFFTGYSSHSQGGESSVQHMEFFTTRENELSQKYLSYMAEVAHGNRARKLEKRRQELIGQIRTSLNEVNRLRPYKGDASLRETYKIYWDILLKVFNEDYDKIVNMEEIAEQSYDHMEAYLMAQQKASEVLGNAQDKIEPVYNAFASKNNIRLIKGGDSKLGKKLRQVGSVNGYYYQIFLIFFKSFKQEAYVMDAFNRKDINGIEQNRNTLIKFAEEGLHKMDTIKAYRGDGSLASACRKVLEFHKVEAEKQIPGLNDFLLKNDEFEKIKKAFDAKPAGKRTKADVEVYNKAVAEINAAMETSNKLLTVMNTSREKAMNNWDVTKKRFMETHVPKGK